MRVAVTGGRGFIGKAVCKELLKTGHFPIVIDRSDGVDLLGPFLASSMESAEAVIHLAGILGTSELFEDAESAIDTNVKGTLRVLEVCHDLGARYVGITMPYVWFNVYQATKKAAYTLAMAWNQHFGVPVSHVRAFNVFGPGQKVGSPQKIIPTFAHRAWRGEALPVWGDGTQSVDLVHVDDVARMLVQALEFGDGSLFDAGTGQAITVNAVAEMVWMAAHAGQDAPLAPIEYLPMRRGEHEAKIVAEGLGWPELGWVPKFSVAAFRQTVESYKPS